MYSKDFFTVFNYFHKLLITWPKSLRSILYGSNYTSHLYFVFIWLFFGRYANHLSFVVQTGIIQVRTPLHSICVTLENWTANVWRILRSHDWWSQVKRFWLYPFLWVQKLAGCWLCCKRCIKQAYTDNLHHIECISVSDIQKKWNIL